MTEAIQSIILMEALRRLPPQSAAGDSFTAVAVTHDRSSYPLWTARSDPQLLTSKEPYNPLALQQMEDQDQ